MWLCALLLVCVFAFLFGWAVCLAAGSFLQGAIMTGILPQAGSHPGCTVMLALFPAGARHSSEVCVLPVFQHGHAAYAPTALAILFHAFEVYGDGGPTVITLQVHPSLALHEG